MRITALAALLALAVCAGFSYCYAAGVGEAEAVADHARSTGATIGKAMTSLKDGRGRVLVLVNLQ